MAGQSIWRSGQPVGVAKSALSPSVFLLVAGVIGLGWSGWGGWTDDGWQRDGWRCSREHTDTDQDMYSALEKQL